MRRLLLVLLLLSGGCARSEVPAGAEYPPRLRTELLTLEERLVLTPDDGAKTARLVHLLRVAGLPDRARGRGTAFVAQYPAAALPVRHVLAELACDAADWTAAITEERAIAAVTGDTPLLQVNLAVIAERSGDDEGARSLLADAVAAAPDRPAVLHAVGDFHLRQAETAAAHAWYLRAFTVAPADPATVVRLGYVAGQRGDWEEAGRCFQEVIRLGDGRTAAAGEGFLGLARVALVTGTMAETREYLGRAQTLLPEQAEPLFLLASLEARQQNDFAALELLNQALLLDPGMAAAHELAGDLMRRQGGVSTEVLNSYRRAARLAPRTVSAALKLAGLHLQRGEAAAARQVLDGMRPAGTEHAEQVALNRAVLEALAGNPAAATAAFAAIPAASPLRSRAEYNRALVALLAGDRATAQAANTAALAIEPRHMHALNNLAVCHALAGDSAAAQALLQQALELRETTEAAANLLRVKG